MAVDGILLVGTAAAFFRNIRATLRGNFAFLRGLLLFGGGNRGGGGNDDLVILNGFCVILPGIRAGRLRSSYYFCV
jgi:hypothetical protein